MTTAKSALVISFTDLSRDPRVQRQMEFLLKMGLKVTTLALNPSQIFPCSFLSAKAEDFPSIKRKLMQLLRRASCRFEAMYWNNIHVNHAFEQAKGKCFDLFVANDIMALPLACRLANGGKVLFDAHEYAPKEFEDSLKWKLLFQDYVKYLCQTYIPKVDAMMTVCEGIAKEYEKEYNVTCHVITNAPYRQVFEPSRVGKSIRMIYHGVATASRSVEDAIAVMDQLDNRFSLDMILVPGCETYIEKIKRAAKKNPRIQFLEPVATSEIPKLCNQYDLGFFPLRAKNFNYFHALPNKFFEFLQARIPPVISPLPEMARLINQYRCGVIADSFSPQSFANQLNSLTSDEIFQMKKNTGQAAFDLSAEVNFDHFESIVTPLL